MQSKTKKMLFSLSSLALSGFLLHHLLTVTADETPINATQQTQKQSTAEKARQVEKNLVKNGSIEENNNVTITKNLNKLYRLENLV